MKITKKQAIENIKKYEKQRKAKQSKLVADILNVIYDKLDSESRAGQKEVNHTFTSPADALITAEDARFIITELQKDGWNASCTPLVTTIGGGNCVAFKIKIMD